MFSFSQKSLKATSALRRSLATVSNATIKATSNGSAPARLTEPAYLSLKTGQTFTGQSFGATQAPATSGETVFTTSLVGYPESMTDPSYHGQILVFTQPLVGNYGVPAFDRDQFGLLRNFESDKIQCKAIVVSDYATRYSHWNAVESLGEWCTRSGIPAISGVDTRALVHLLRDQGSTLGALTVGGSKAPATEEVEFVDPNTDNLVAKVSVTEPQQFNPGGDVKIAVVDCGIKQNILRCLVARGAAVTLLPWNYNFNAVADHFDGLFISNGPGSPTKCTPLIQNVRQAYQTFNKPIFGICMGNQIMGMAAGLDVYKMRYGNRGHNQPAVNLTNGQCVITSQNHGFALKDDGAMPSGWQRYFVNANDGSNEGIRHSFLPFSSVQFHPEAKGGPQDTQYLFDSFLTQVREAKIQRTTQETAFHKNLETATAEPVSVAA
ncbi:Multifunctional pyrimidine synthesis protein CAD [Dimargaris cristalligena]|uniref:Carbamoyl phosphate synthase arginine-specific small chain n=1 Tax=Dimargaris cristalligena TaxID=215637 RepID=A0A4P9ZTN2_9FUNG|nr:Multifunctional pyrimidine synthesis protein CAD [Dimargaris cristalligena]RKP36944.1 small subunit of carbamoyl-phosphate synthase [Dimargaris cristalligena]|eukprot:RKP36944.1 small subunit of carbamoyl-phosphate synthase [Dimargaris cristalligena]